MTASNDELKSYVPRAVFPQPESEFVHDVLWTSGWDSTFRVADLVITYGRAVRPHYLIDPSRLSTEKELTTITELSDAIAARREDGGSLLLPPRLHQRSELSTDPETRAQLRRLRTVAYLGPQYDLLVALARSLASHELELCILKGDWAYQLLRLVDADVTCDRAPRPTTPTGSSTTSRIPTLPSSHRFDFLSSR